MSRRSRNLPCHVSGDLGLSKKVEVAGGPRPHICNSQRVHYLVIRIPHRNRGQFISQNSLYLDIIRSSHRSVLRCCCLCQQSIHPRVGVAATIATLWRKTSRPIGISKDVRVFIAADPSKCVNLKCSLRNIGIERPKLSRTDIQANPSCSQLLLQNRRHQSRALVCAGLHRQAHTHAILPGRKASFIQQPLRSRHIVGIQRHLCIVRRSPVSDRQQGIRQASLPPPYRLHNCLPVDRRRHSLSHAFISEQRVGYIEG